MTARRPGPCALAAGSRPAAVLIVTALLLGNAACVTGGGKGGARPQQQEPPAPRAPLATDDVAKRVQSVADRFIGREAQAFQELEARTTNPTIRAWARMSKVAQALAAMSIATGPNPYENAVDLVVLITLKRASIEANEARTLLSAEEAGPLIEAYRGAESTAWELAERTLTAPQVDEVKGRIAQFQRENPGLRYTGFVRFTDLARDGGAAGAAGAKKRSAAPSSLLSLLFLDPLAGLDPATRELRESRLMVERAVYFFQRMPIVVQWQIQMVTADLLELQESKRVITATTQLAGAADRISETVAAYPQAIGKERAAAISQVERALDEQRRAAVADLDAEQAKLRGLMADVRSSVADAEAAGMRVNAAVGQTVAAAEGAAGRTLTLGFRLALALLACGLVGIPLSALLYRRAAGPERARHARPHTTLSFPTHRRN